MKESNVSNLTKALAVVSILTPATGLPLSIGDIELHSALNQNLNAEIRLHVAAGENPSEVSVHLAPPEKFDQAGIPWSYFLTNIRFEPVVQANGTIIVKVTSKEALTEPFLDFLLEVTWPQGAQFREFTLLIDPPVGYNQPVIPVASESSGYRDEPLVISERPKKQRPTTTRTKTVDTTSDITPQTPSSGEFGPTQQADTLWRIAEQLGQERGVTTKQMMNALYRANPEAFNRNDMDSLKAGVTLRIPEMAEVQKVAAKPAQPRGESKPVRKEPTTTGKPLELVAPTEAIAESGQVKPGQEAEAGKKPGAATDAGKEAEGKALELQARIEKLEQQLSLMKQMVELKDQQLATFNKGGTPVPAPTSKPIPTAEQPTQQTVQPTSQPLTEHVAQPTVEPVVPVAVQPTPLVSPKPTSLPQPTPVEHEEGIFSSDSYYLVMGGFGAGMLGVLGWLLWRKRRIEEQTNTESMFASASQIRMPDSESSLSVPVMELGGGAGAYDVGTVGESSFISDFTPSDFDAFDTDQSEVDPLSEADVYLAYGRYQQAEELIRHALAENAERDDFKLKLLEIFYAGENKEGFAAYVQELAAEGKDRDRPFWTKVSDMAKEIVPDLPLFGGSPSAAGQNKVENSTAGDASVADSDARLDSDKSDFSLPDDFSELNFSSAGDISELDADLVDLSLDFAHPSKHDDNGLDFDLSSSFDRPVEQKQKPTPVASANEIESIDFDLGSLSSVEEKHETEDVKNEIESFDFNFDMDASQTPAEQEVDATPDAALDLDLEQSLSLDAYDFSGFDVDKPEVVASPKKILPEDADETIGEFDFNFDFDAPVVGGQDGEDFDLSVGDLTDMDEFETKIDLAKAYLDMGDADAAKAIAEEVLSKGTKAQQAVAQSLLDELK